MKMKEYKGVNEDDLIDNDWWDNSQLESRASANKLEYGVDSMTRKEIIEEVKKQIYEFEGVYTKKIYDEIHKVIKAEYENRIASLEKQIKELKKTASSLEVRTNSPDRKSKKGGNRIDMNKDFIEIVYKFGEWVFYLNNDMGDFLYKVRKDGTDNQQLTDYSVTSGFFRVENSKLYFRDKKLREHSVDI